MTNLKEIDANIKHKTCSLVNLSQPSGFVSNMKFIETFSCYNKNCYTIL